MKNHDMQNPIERGSTHLASKSIRVSWCHPSRGILFPFLHQLISTKIKTLANFYWLFPYVHFRKIINWLSHWKPCSRQYMDRQGIAQCIPKSTLSEDWKSGFSTYEMQSNHILVNYTIAPGLLWDRQLKKKHCLHNYYTLRVSVGGKYSWYTYNM